MKIDGKILKELDEAGLEQFREEVTKGDLESAFATALAWGMARAYIKEGSFRAAVVETCRVLKLAREKGVWK